MIFEDYDKYLRKIKREFKKQAITIDLLMLNTIEKYIKVYLITLEMEINIEEKGLVYEYTNKANQTNIVKNPIVAEYKAYINELNKTTKAILDAVKIQGAGAEETNELGNFFAKFTENKS